MTLVREVFLLVYILCLKIFKELAEKCKKAVRKIRRYLGGEPYENFTFYCHLLELLAI